jgi:outer membrane protein assembly factor BamE (lipoprotein component of BamABCDE complex)
MSPASHTIEVWLVALVVTVALLTGFGMFARWCSLSPAVSRKKLAQLRVGMTPDEITALLGQPRQTRTSAEGLRQWIYGAPMKRHVLLIEFSTHNQLQSFAHGVPHARASRPSGSYEG